MKDIFSKLINLFLKASKTELDLRKSLKDLKDTVDEFSTIQNPTNEQTYQFMLLICSKIKAI
jgi:hypothetical protein